MTETPPGGGLRDGLDEADPEVVAGEVLSSDQLFYELDPGVDSTSFKYANHLLPPGSVPVWGGG